VVVIKVAGIDWHHTFSLGLLSAFLTLLGMQTVMMGLIAEMQIRTYHESQKKPIYLVRECLGFPAPPEERR
jgi:hypothetical protein